MKTVKLVEEEGFADIKGVRQSHFLGLRFRISLPGPTLYLPLRKEALVSSVPARMHIGGAATAAGIVLSCGPRGILEVQ